MKRLLTLLVFLALAGYLAFKGGVWWLAEQRLSEADQAVDETGVINPGSIRSGLSGTLTLEDAFYEDFRLSQPLKMGRLVFDAGSPEALVRALLDPSSPPTTWSLRGERLSMALDDALFRNWVTASGEETGAPALFAPVCGPDHRQQLGTGDLVRLGVLGLAGEILVRQERSGLYAEITTIDTGSLEISWPGARFNPADPTAVMDSGGGEMQVTLRDGGLMRRISAYCSREAGLDTAQWTQVVMESFREALEARGYQASDQLIALYRQWLTEGGELMLELDPAEATWGVPVGPADPFITYNGARVPDVYLLAVEPDPARVPEQAMEPIVDSAPGGQVGWQPADPENAAELIGRTVRVTLANGNVVEGRLAGMMEDRLEIARIVGGGEVAYPIAIRLIETFEVWRRQNP